MRRNRLIGLASAALASVLVVIMAAGPAAAAQVVQDPHDVSWPFDTRAMKVWRNNNGYVTVALSSNTFSAGPHWNGVAAVFDSRGAGFADFRVEWDFGGDGDGWSELALYRVNGSDTIGRVACHSLDAKATKKDGWINVYLFVPRPCLAITKNVGVKGVSIDWTRYRANGSPRSGLADYTPNSGFAR